MTLSSDRWTSGQVEAALYGAGRTLMALPPTGYSTRGYRSCMPEVLPQGLKQEFGNDYLKYVTPSRSRPPTPPPEAISLMDMVLSWIMLLPGKTDAEVKIRRLVGARCLVNPRTDAPIYSWDALGSMIGCSEKTAKTRFLDAVSVITAALNRPGLCTASGGKVGVEPDRIRWTRRPTRISYAAMAELVEA